MSTESHVATVVLDCGTSWSSNSLGLLRILMDGSDLAVSFAAPAAVLARYMKTVAFSAWVSCCSRTARTVFCFSFGPHCLFPGSVPDEGGIPRRPTVDVRQLPPLQLPGNNLLQIRRRATGLHLAQARPPYRFIRVWNIHSLSPSSGTPGVQREEVLLPSNPRT